MKKKYTFFVAIGLVLSFSTKAQQASMQTLADEITHYFPRQPDSAVFFLHKYLRYKDQLSDSLLVRTYNKLGVSYGQLTRQDSARYFFKKGVASAVHFPKLRGNIYQNWAQSERFAGNYDTTFRVLDSAEKYYRKSDFKSGLGMSLTERGTGYLYMDSLVRAIHYFKKAIHVFKENGDTTYIIYARQDLASTYLQHGDHAFAIDLYRKILPTLKRSGGVNYYNTLINYGDSWFYEGNYHRARVNYKKVFQFFKKNGGKKFYYYSMSKLGNIAFKTGSVDTAAVYLKKAFNGLYTMKSALVQRVAAYYIAVLNKRGDYKDALEVVRKVRNGRFKSNMELSDRLYYLGNVKETLAKNRLFQSAYKVGEQESALKDSVYDFRMQRAQDSLLAKYQNEYHLQQNIILTQRLQLLQNENKSNRRLIILLAFIFILLVGGFVLFYRKQQKENKLKKESFNHLTLSVVHLEEKLEAEQQLKKERRAALEEKKRELVAESLRIANIKNTLEDIICDCSAETPPHQLKRRLKMLLKEENDWNFFKRKFVDVYPEFSESLRNKFPQLTQKDLDFCALIRLNLSNKEMATILHISHQSVITKRYRLRKKLNIPEGEERTENSWLREHMI